MAGPIVDIHPHIIAADQERYPLSPLFGIQSGWSRDRPADMGQLIAAMDGAGVAKAAIVHASTCYGFDNSYVVDSVQNYAGRCTAVGSVDMLADGAVEEAKRWLDRGLTGLRIFTGGSTKDVDASSLDDRAAYPVWELMNERGLPICVQTDVSGIPAMMSLAKRFPNVPVIVDHFAAPDASGGSDFTAAQPLFSMAERANIYLKFTPIVTLRLEEFSANVIDLMTKVVSVFGSDRIAWGSNFPNSPGTLAEIVAAGEAALSGVGSKDRDAIMGGTGQRLYPSLAV
ncbi:MAG: amidohydrolase [Beijerinckiaceae bacterium]|nr:amidohydrolase [Beijerinckiaceae bacterium]